MDSVAILTDLGITVGAAVGITTVWNTVTLRREAGNSRRVEQKKAQEDQAVVATAETIAHLTNENARLWSRLELLDKEFEEFKRISNQRDDEYKKKITGTEAASERNRGQLIFLRREIMALFKRIAAASKPLEGTPLGITLASEMAAFVQSVHTELGPLGENPVMIGTEDRQQGE